jgi:hypothetical protein
MGEVAAKRPEWVTAQVGGVTHSVIALRALTARPSRASSVRIVVNIVFI